MSFKPVLQHSLLYFQHFQSYFQTMNGVVAKIRAKSSVFGLLTGFTAFAVLFLRIWSLFESIEGTVAKIWAKMFICLLLNWIYGIHCSFFCTLEVIFRRSQVLLLRYGQKRSLAGLETSITAFAVLFLALWTLFQSIEDTVAKIRVKTFTHLL